MDGVFYREFTKVNGFTDFTTLSVVHTHYLMLGMVFFLLLVVVEKNFHFVDNKVLKYLLFYHIGLNLTVVMLVVRGVVQVLSLDVSSAVLFWNCTFNFRYFFGFGFDFNSKLYQGFILTISHNLMNALYIKWINAFLSAFLCLDFCVMLFHVLYF